MTTCYPSTRAYAAAAIASAFFGTFMFAPVANAGRCHRAYMPTRTPIALTMLLTERVATADFANTPSACASSGAGFDLRASALIASPAPDFYGLIMADNGSSMYLTGAPDNRWDNNDLHNLAQVTASDFEVVEMNPVYTSGNVPQGAAPTITSFSASPATISTGSSSTLTFTVDNASYVIISPERGAVRGASVTVHPTQTTTYTLYATNQYGRTTSTVTVNVQ